MGQGLIVPNAGFGKGIGVSQSMASLPTKETTKSVRPSTAFTSAKTKAVILRLTTPS